MIIQFRAEKIGKHAFILGVLSVSGALAVSMIFYVPVWNSFGLWGNTPALILSEMPTFTSIQDFIPTLGGYILHDHIFFLMSLIAFPLLLVRVKYSVLEVYRKYYDFASITKQQQPIFATDPLTGQPLNPPLLLGFKDVVIDTEWAPKNEGRNLLLSSLIWNNQTGVGTGFSYACTLKPDIVVLLDGDSQHNPEEIPSLIEPILQGQAILVVGERDFTKMSTARRASNLLTSRILHDWFKVGLRDVQCGFRAVRTDALKTMPLRQNGYPWACEMLIQAQQLRLKMKSVPIETISPEKSGIQPLRDSFQFLRMIIKETEHRSHRQHEGGRRK